MEGAKTTYFRSLWLWPLLHDVMALAIARWSYPRPASLVEALKYWTGEEGIENPAGVDASWSF